MSQCLEAKITTTWKNSTVVDSHRDFEGFRYQYLDLRLCCLFQIQDHERRIRGG